VRLNVAPNPPRVGQDVVFTTDITGGSPTSWAWTIQRATGTVEATSGSAEFHHQFPTAGDYLVTLTIADATHTDQQSTTITVTPVTGKVGCGTSIVVSVTLTADLVCTTNTGLVIAADDIVVDLGGHTIRGSGRGTGIADGTDVAGRPATSHSRVTIRNGAVTGFQVGIDLEGSTQATVVNTDVLSVLQTNGRSLTVQGGRASFIDVHNSGSASITGVTMTQGTLDIWDSPGARIAHSMFNFVLVFPLRSPNAVFEDNTVTGHGMTVDHSPNWVIRGNRIENTELGLRILEGSPDGSQVVNNIFRGNRQGLSMTVPSLNNSTGFTVTGNTFTDNANYGLYIGLVQGQAPPTDAPVTIADNTLDSNGRQSQGQRDIYGSLIDDGLHVGLPRGVPVTVTLRNNHTLHNFDYGIESQPGLVIDGGGNTSVGDGRGCLGVVCS
jgi:PKD repeat protein